MKNILAITLGTRDVQIKISNINSTEFYYDGKVIYHKLNPEVKLEGSVPEGFEDTFCLKTPRISGRTIVENLFFHSLLHFPLIDPVLDFLEKKQIKIDLAFLLFTDQSGEYNNGLVKLKDYNNDTLYFSSIVSEHLKKVLQLDYIDEYPVWENATNIDYLYTHFEKEAKSLFDIDTEDIDKIYLLPQGGIDQVNQAFTLKLIQKFGDKVLQIQQAEKKEPAFLKFPRLFLEDLEKQKMIRQANDYDFESLYNTIKKSYSNLSYSRRFSLLAARRLNLNYLELKPVLESLNMFIQEQEFKSALIFLDTNELRLKDLCLSSKVACHQRRFGDFLWRIFTLGENIFKIKIAQVLNQDPDRFIYTVNGTQNYEWWKAIGADAKQHLELKGVSTLRPNRRAYKELYFYYKQKNKLAKSLEYKVEDVKLASLFDRIENLSKHRNGIAHSLKPVREVDINNALGKNYSIQNLLSDIDDILQINGFDYLEPIKGFILTEIGRPDTYV